MQTIITLQPLLHKGNNQIAIGFNYSTEIKNHIQLLKEVSWSQTHKTFYIESTAQNKKKLYLHLREKNWFIDYSAIQTTQQPVLKNVPSPKNNSTLLSLNEEAVIKVEKFINW